MRFLHLPMSWVASSTPDLGGWTGHSLRCRHHSLADHAAFVHPVQFRVGMVAELGACFGWMIDKESVSVTFGAPLYNGPAADLLHKPVAGGLVGLGPALKKGLLLSN